MISESDILHVMEVEIVDNTKEQNFIEAKRIQIYRRDEQIPSNELPTKDIILLFNAPNLPKSTKAGYLSCSVQPYIRNPVRCFRCQRFVHSRTSS